MKARFQMQPWPSSRPDIRQTAAQIEDASMTTSANHRKLLFLPEHGVLVCRTHRYCLRPGGTKEHFREFHKSLALRVRQELVKYSDALGVRLVAPKEVRSPPEGSTPIEGLELLEGCKCTECGYLCGRIATAREHAKSHGWTKSKGACWIPQPVWVP